jgi:hypothetical protein
LAREAGQLVITRNRLSESRMKVLRPLPTIASITAISQLVPGKFIYLVLNGDGDHIVVKNENHPRDAETVSHSYAMMAKISPGGEAKLLSSEEQGELSTFVADSIADLRLHNQAIPTYLTDLDDALTSARNSKWVKMREVSNLSTLADAINALGTQAANRKDGVRTFARMLNGGQGLEALGRMIAIDAYNHNLDRFDPTLVMVRDLGQPGMKQEVQDGPTRTSRRVMVNSGNVFTTFQAKQHLLVGLDSYDPSNVFSLRSTIADQERKAAGLWAGWILQPNPRAQQWRKKYSELIALDLDDALGSRHRRFSFLKQTRLDSNAPHRLRTGFKQGMEILCMELLRLHHRGGASAGIIDRYNILVLGEGKPHE